MFYKLLHIDTPVSADWQKLTFICCVDTGYHLEDSSIRMNGGRESRESMLSACLDDDEAFDW